ncbi:MAG: hypothetical protein M1819_001431 [Sarea resinae]|nr:MAG: hypothetical protein M1819_001431 [Sarea resinae]
MSFFGFDTTLPRDRGHPTNAPGFGQAPDPFAGVARGGVQNEDDALDFEDTYDGLADKLDETDDAFNDDTFGGEEPGISQAPVGKDFDFFGQTAKVSDAINEEQLRYARHQGPEPPQPEAPAKPTRTGYEKYREPGAIPDLQVSADLWGVAPRRGPSDFEEVQHRSSGYGMPAPEPSSTAASAKRMMSLEEVEAAMRAQSRHPAPPQPQLQQPQVPTPIPQIRPQQHHQQQQQQQQPQQQQPPTILQRPTPPGIQQPYPGYQAAPSQAHPVHHQGPQFPQRSESQGQPIQRAQILQRQQPTPALPAVQRSSPQPRQILRNPNRQTPPTGPRGQEILQARQQAPPTGPSTSSNQAHVITNPQQLLHLSEEERTAFLIEDAKRAKRNHKIYLLSKDNGLMTPQDKNFITRIQLQQLVTATGGLNDQGPEASLAEDFYYQVHSQIRGGPRQTPHQPLSHFAQTYLFQTGGRQGLAGRRHNRGADNHMQRMEQQVQRAVEAAKLKPKNKQLVIEGSLGKISFSNAKTPKPLLNFKRQDSGDVHRAHDKKHAPVSVSDRKAILRNIEGVYSALMQLEDHERRMPPPPTEEGDAAAVQQHMEWRVALQNLKEQLWRALKVMDPIMPNSPGSHPFIQFLSFPKGKKAIPRIFRHIDQEQRLTILTMIVVHLDQLDVIRRAHLQPGEVVLPTAVREEVELFSQAVMPSLFGYVNEAPLEISVGLMALILEKVNVQAVAYTKIGVAILTMLVSRAELLKQSGEIDDAEWEQWVVQYDRLFDILEPELQYIFPDNINSGDDVYVWQFLAALGIEANPDQQQRLVIAVKDRVLGTVVQAKTLPPEMASQKLANVNLFMRAIGLDVELLG